MPQGKHPQGPKLRQAKGNKPSEDIGALHVLDRLLHLACKPWQDGTFGPRPAPNEIWLTFRDLDGEEEREGLYR